MSTERSLGDRWRDTREGQGAWIVKMPASTTAGIPDWCLLLGTIQLWEAKKIQAGKTAFDPKQLSGAQRFFIKMIACYAPTCGGVLLLGDDGFMELPADRAKRTLAASTFHRNKEPYQ